MGGTTLLVAASDAASPEQRAYFERLEREAERAYAVARQARSLGWDPSKDVEIVFAQDLAARVEAQVQLPGVAQLVRELTRELGERSRELVALEVARRVADGQLGRFAGPAEAIDRAVRAGLSVLTEGVLVAPLEGIAKVTLGRNDDGTDYVDLYFAGPIRAAGGTAQAMSVLLADVVRRELGIGRYQPTQAEIERYKEEVPAYKQAQHLQSIPSNDEIERIVRHCPVCINGEGTEDEEVTGHRDLPRVETNRLRGGAVLVIAEGLTQKAKKIAAHVNKLGLTGWEFIQELAARKEESHGAEASASPGSSSDKYLQDLIAGRPVFAHPSRPGGFRLRYGRSRTAGLASTSIHPVTMRLVDDFIAVGTQLKLERPGKGTVATPCASLEGPRVVLSDGSFVQLSTEQELDTVKGEIRRITDLGDILIPFGEFAENNAVLGEPSWTREWWQELVKAKTGKPPSEADETAIAADFERARAFARSTDTPLHPVHTLLWHDATIPELKALVGTLASEGAWIDARLESPSTPPTKETLISLGCLHRERDGRIIVEAPAAALLAGLGLRADGHRLVPGEAGAWAKDRAGSTHPSVDLASELAGVALKPRAPTWVGARLGRPEKADARKMDPPVHGIFPVGDAGGPRRDLAEASRASWEHDRATGSQRRLSRAAGMAAPTGADLDAGPRPIVVTLARRRCGTCERVDWHTRCTCGAHTEDLGQAPAEQVLHIHEERLAALRRLGLDKGPPLVKGVKGLSSRSKTPEPMEKGILRALHDVYVFKDGTCRFDMTDAPLTHFRPREIGTSVERLRELGYTHDIQGHDLVGPEQLLELRPQDIVPSRRCGEYLAHVAHFVDDLLERLHHLPRYYNVNRGADLVGHLVAGLAPHTSAAVLARIIGFTEACVGWGHPFFHASKRRNCDGDEDAVLLLLDALLNFSRSYVPDKRGGLMDLPLVLSLRVDPREVDKEAHNLDVLFRYPLAFYEAAERRAMAKEVAPLMGLVESRLGTPAQFEGFGFTHDTPDIQAGPPESSYKTMGKMEDKMHAELSLAQRLRGVDVGDVANRVIGTHLLPDIVGNLKAFAQQEVRCTKCGEKYRRAPLAGHCTKRLGPNRTCGNKLILTVHEAGVRKYLELSLDLIHRYPVPEYTRQRVLLARQFVEASFAPDRFRDLSLQQFL